MLDGRASVDAVREMTGGRGADLVLDFVGTDQTHADSMAMLARGGTYSIVGFGGMVACRRPGSSATSTTVAGSLVGTWLDLWEVMQLHARRNAWCSRPRCTRWTRSTRCSRSSHEGEITGRAVLVPG